MLSLGIECIYYSSGPGNACLVCHVNNILRFLVDVFTIVIMAMYLSIKHVETIMKSADGSTFDPVALISWEYHLSQSNVCQI